MRVSSDSYSRYNNVEIINDGEAIRQETWDEPRIVQITGDRYVVPAKFENRLDLIANLYLGSPLLWWVIAYASGIKNPFNVPSGTVLAIPDTETQLRIRGAFTYGRN